MPGRLDLRPLFAGLADGLRLRRNTGDEPADRFTRGVLIVVPVGSGVAACLFRVQLSHADQLIAGAALLIGALLSSFAVIAAWRERLLARSLQSDQSNLRALNEAAAHILVAALAATALVIMCAVLSNLDLDPKDPSCAGVIVARTLSAAAIVLFAYITLTLVIVINLLWDAYLRAGQGHPSANRQP